MQIKKTTENDKYKNKHKMVMTNISDKDSEGGARLTSEKYSLKPLACAIGAVDYFSLILILTVPPET